MRLTLLAEAAEVYRQEVLFSSMTLMYFHTLPGRVIHFQHDDTSIDAATFRFIIGPSPASATWRLVSLIHSGEAAGLLASKQLSRNGQLFQTSRPLLLGYGRPCPIGQRRLDAASRMTLDPIPSILSTPFSNVRHSLCGRSMSSCMVA